MRSFSEKDVKKSKHTFYVQQFPTPLHPLQIRFVYEIRRKNVVKADRPQMTK